MEFYLNGDTAPNQRFAYSYRFIGDNKGDKSPALTIALGAGLVVLSILIVIVILISNKKKRGING